MTLLTPHIGQIVTCDFRSGFEAPEMTKIRPVLVLSSALPGRQRGLATVVSLSLGAPLTVEPYHMKLPEYCVPGSWYCEGMESWVKGDVVTTVSYRRLCLIEETQDRRGRRRFFTRPIDSELMQQVYACVLRGMNLGALAQYLPFMQEGHDEAA